MSKFRDVKAAFDQLAEEQLSDGDEKEAHFRYWLLRLLFEINSNLDSMSASYRAMSKFYEARNAVGKLKDDPKG